MKINKVLLVDDEPFLLEVMQKIIRQWGYQLSTASNGKEALEKINNNKPDVVILDYMMPVMDGIATLEEIRKSDKELPVIIFSAYYPDERELEGIKKLGVSKFLIKLDAYADSRNTLKKALEELASK